MTVADKSSTFTILLVDDNPRTLSSIKRSAESLLKINGMVLKWIVNESGRNILEQLKKEIIDVVLIDHNISEQVKGIFVLKEIRNDGGLVDAIFYSAKTNQTQIFNDARYVEFTEVVENRNIWPVLEKLINKNLARWKDLRFLRGVAISKAIDFELDINEFLEKYFKIANNKTEDFRNFILENSYNSLEGKRKTLLSIAKKLQLKNDFKPLCGYIDKIQKTRNLLAHCKASDSTANELVCMGEPEIFTKKRIDEHLTAIKNASVELERIQTKINTASKTDV